MDAGPQPPRESALIPFSSLGLRAARTTAAVVGRRAQTDAVEVEFAAAKNGLSCISVEGEPGIGKTRFLLALEELANLAGFAVAAITADEKIRVPFLVARSLFRVAKTFMFTDIVKS